MANYFIIGGDDKVYGPISGEELRQWIAEGRLAGASRAKMENDADFRPLTNFPEFATALRSHAPAESFSADPFSTPAATNFVERDYDLDIGGCIARGYELFKENFGLLFLGCLIMVAVQIGFSVMLGVVTAPLNKILLHLPVLAQLGFRFLLPLVSSLVMGPMAGGVYYLFLKKIRGEEASVGDVFAGFQKAFAQLYLGVLVIGLVSSACMSPFQYVMQVKTAPLLEQMQHAQTDPQAAGNLLFQVLLAMANSLPVLLVCLVPVTFLAVSWLFTLPLIIDKEMNYATAMKTSWKMVLKHWWHVFGLFVLASLISGVGLFACGIGMLFTVPIGIAATMFAYETLFGAEKN